LRRGQGVLPPAGSRAETVCQPTTSPEVARGSMAIGGAVSVAAVRHMHSTVERETDQLKNADANTKIGVSADGCGGQLRHPGSWSWSRVASLLPALLSRPAYAGAQYEISTRGVAKVNFLSTCIAQNGRRMCA
jgi:hypothetical protein